MEVDLTSATVAAAVNMGILKLTSLQRLKTSSATAPPATTPSGGGQGYGFSGQGYGGGQNCPTRELTPQCSARSALECPAAGSGPSIVSGNTPGWTLNSNKHCAGNTLSDRFWSVQEAMQRCAQMGSACAGVDCGSANTGNSAYSARTQ